MATISWAQIAYQAVVAYAVGRLIQALTPNATATGPRLTELKASGSAYGTPVSIGYGTVRVPGNIIWAAAIREKETTQSVGGKGGGGTDVTTYAYFGSFAVAWAAGPAATIRRIWWDTKLVYDVAGSIAPELSDVGGVYGDLIGQVAPGRRTASTRYAGFNVRNYLGDELQLPDPLIVSGTNAGAADGTGTLTPGYRGLVYTVFDDCPLADFANRIPQLSAEIAFASESEQHILDSAPLVLPVWGGGGTLYHAVDWVRGIYVVGTSYNQNSNDGLRAFSLDTNREYMQKTWPEVLWGTGFPNVLGIAFGPNGMLYGCGEDSAVPSKAFIAEIDPATLTATRYMHGEKDELIWTTQWVPLRLLSPKKSANFIAYITLVAKSGGSNIVAVFDCDKMTKIYEQALGDRAGLTVCIGAQAAEGTYFYTYKVNDGSSAAMVDEYLIDNDGLVYCRNVWAINATDFDPSWFSLSAASPTLRFDQTTGDLILSESGNSVGGSDYCTMRFRFDALGVLHVAWRVFGIPDDGGNGEPGGMDRLTSGNLVIGNGEQFALINTATGAYTVVHWNSAIVAAGHTAAWVGNYDSVRDAVLVSYHLGTEAGMALFLFGRMTAGTASLGSIVQDICTRVGLEASDVDVSRLTQQVRGYLLNAPATARSNIEPLSLAFMFDGAESDYILKFVPRGDAPGTNLPAVDLIVQDAKSGDIVKETRGQEAELPSRVTLTYNDQDHDYQTGAQSARRITLPAPTTGAFNEMTQTVPIVLNALEAKQMAEKMLYALWVERLQQDIKTLPRYLANDPLDVVTINLPDGSQFVSRIISLDVGADLSIEARCVADDPTIYVSTTSADTGTIYPQTIPSDAFAVLPTRPFVIDCPAMLDSAISGAPTSNILWASSVVAGASTFAGAVLQTSADASAYVTVGTATEAIPWGSAISALADVASPWGWDEANTLKLSMGYGGDTLASTTELAVLNGANPALVIDISGTVELIQFQNVTLNSDGSYTLSRLLRGRRGTDTMTGGHAAGASIVFPSVASLHIYPLTLGAVNLLRYYRSVGQGTNPADAPVKQLTSIGRDLMPYAPVNVAAALSGGDIVLTWQRRTRYGGELKDGSGLVPLGETAEAYEVDIYNGAAVVRTLTASTPTVTYLAADIATDLGGTPASLTLTPYQMSSVIGRGFGRQATVGVN